MCIRLRGRIGTLVEKDEWSLNKAMFPYYSIIALDWNGLMQSTEYDGLTDIEIFVHKFELQIPKQKILLALDVVLKATPAFSNNCGIREQRYVGMQDCAIGAQAQHTEEICLGPESSNQA
jgi:hypothetical protein